MYLIAVSRKEETVTIEGVTSKTGKVRTVCQVEKLQGFNFYDTGKGFAFHAVPEKGAAFSLNDENHLSVIAGDYDSAIECLLTADSISWPASDSEVERMIVCASEVKAKVIVAKAQTFDVVMCEKHEKKEVN